MADIDQVLEERGSRYGAFIKQANLSQRLKYFLKTESAWDNLDYDMQEALEMICHKMARILNGDPNYVDSWTDIIGYARLVEKRLLQGK